MSVGVNLIESLQSGETQLLIQQVPFSEVFGIKKSINPVESLVLLVEKDASVASILIRYANNSQRATHKQISDIKKAVIKLGLTTSINIYLTCLFGQLASRDGVLPLAKELLSLSVATGIVYDQISTDNGVDQYLVGLLSRLGGMAAVSYQHLHPEAVFFDGNYQNLRDVNLSLLVDVCKSFSIPESVVRPLQAFVDGDNPQLQIAMDVASVMNNFLPLEQSCLTSEEFDNLSKLVDESPFYKAVS